MPQNFGKRVSRRIDRARVGKSLVSDVEKEGVDRERPINLYGFIERQFDEPGIPLARMKFV